MSKSFGVAQTIFIKYFRSAPINIEFWSEYLSA